jgi:hypothetical protein
MGLAPAEAAAGMAENAITRQILAMKCAMASLAGTRFVESNLNVPNPTGLIEIA